MLLIYAFMYSEISKIIIMRLGDILIILKLMIAEGTMQQLIHHFNKCIMYLNEVLY